MGAMLPDGSPTQLGDVGQPEASGRELRCSICARKIGKSIVFLEETGDVPEPRQSWVLCQACADAVRQQMAQAPVHGPLRLRVAVGVVSTERTPTARRARRGQLTDVQWMKLLFVAFILAMLAHLALIVVVAGLAH